MWWYLGCDIFARLYIQESNAVMTQTYKKMHHLKPYYSVFSRHNGQLRTCNLKTIRTSRSQYKEKPTVEKNTCMPRFYFHRSHLDTCIGEIIRQWQHFWYKVRFYSRSQQAAWRGNRACLRLASCSSPSPSRSRRHPSPKRCYERVAT